MGLFLWLSYVVFVLLLIAIAEWWLDHDDNSFLGGFGFRKACTALVLTPGFSLPCGLSKYVEPYIHYRRVYND